MKIRISYSLIGIVLIAMGSLLLWGVGGMLLAAGSALLFFGGRYY